MPTTKKIGRYSPEYAQTFLAALDAPVIIKLESNEAAKRLRERYYAFRRYLENIATGESPEADRAAILAPVARMSITDNVLTIYYEDQDNDRDASERSSTPTANNPPVRSENGDVP